MIGGSAYMDLEYQRHQHAFWHEGNLHCLDIALLGVWKLRTCWLSRTRVTIMAFSVEKVRAQFPALAQDQVFMDNAGGSQVLSTVIESIEKYLKFTNV